MDLRAIAAALAVLLCGCGTPSRLGRPAVIEEGPRDRPVTVAGIHEAFFRDRPLTMAEVGDVDVSEWTFDDLTDLQRACALGDAESVRSLVSGTQHLRRAEAIKEFLVPPIHLAACYGHTNVALILLESGVSIDEGMGFSGFTPLMGASQTGDLNMVEFLVEHGADIQCHPEAYDSNALLEACRFGHTNVVRFLEQREAPVTSGSE
jgi:ankyrin repeat protein